MTGPMRRKLCAGPCGLERALVLFPRGCETCFACAPPPDRNRTCAACRGSHPLTAFRRLGTRYALVCLGCEPAPGDAPAPATPAAWPVTALGAAFNGWLRSR